MALKNFIFGLFPDPLDYNGSITNSQNIKLLRDLYEFLEKEGIPFDKRKKELAYRCEYEKDGKMAQYRIYDISDNLINVVFIDNENNTIDLIRNPK